MDNNFRWFRSPIIGYVFVLLWLSSCNLSQSSVAPSSEKQTPPEQVTTRPTVAAQNSITPISTQRSSINCPQIQESSLRSLEFGRLKAEDAQRWLKQDSPFKEADIFVSPALDKSIGALIWEQAEIEYDARFRKNTLVSIFISWPNSVSLPTADKVLACLGPPDLYETAHTVDPDGPYIQLTLWYLKKGIIVWADEDGLREIENRTPSIKGELLMQGMTFVAPNTAEEMIRTGFAAGEEADFRNTVLETLEPWHGSWGKVKISSVRF